MSIRRAKIDDALEIQKLVLSLSHFYLDDKNASLPEWFLKTLELIEFKQRLLSDNFSNFLFRLDNKIVGYISIKNESHIYHLFVAEDHQGKGIANKLWRHVKSIVEAKNKSNLFTVRSSVFAMPVYKSFGFEITEPASSKDGLSFQAMERIS